MLRILLTSVCIVLMLAACPVHADILYFNADDNNGGWSESGVWHPSSCNELQSVNGDWNCGDDDECDTAIICSGETANLDGEADAQSVSVQSTGVLNIDDDGLLNLVEDGGISDIDGTVNLEGEMRFDWRGPFLNPPGPGPFTHTVDGDGAVIGEVPAARIKVSGDDGSGASYVNELHLIGTIRGTLQMVWIDEAYYTTRLVLDGGTLHADGGDLLLMGLADMDDTACSLLKVSTSTSSVLEIDLRCGGSELLCTQICLEYTDTEVLLGTFRLVDNNFTTENTLTMNTASKIVILEGATARFQAPTNACQL